MKPARGFLHIFDSLTDRILCVAGAVLFAQGPEFMQQYLQRLGGHLDEARRQLAVFQKTAGQAGLSLDQFIRQTGTNADPAVARLGGVMTDAADRVTSLQAAHDALLHSALWERPIIFLRHLDVGIARATGSVYQPAVPTTVEGLIYALVGMLCFLALYHFGLKNLLRVFRRPAGPRPAAA
ncbi:hypothetical protein Verru16b_02130 [Lacunisphaera limnophila]|uniref:DUF2937 domain-containing protein n=1 Tax=Lacunisphaera limnophila TaxID=1838286 RepID=A0A1D8AW05_9BACT|nr:DUF2937 family protein [Lacunisphaera limnophila]AOS45061.1 hypothetical protein Verru16b_02130 [Lacunisphaera limnophila]